MHLQYHSHLDFTFCYTIVQLHKLKIKMAVAFADEPSEGTIAYCPPCNEWQMNKCHLLGVQLHVVSTKGFQAMCRRVVYG